MTNEYILNTPEAQRKIGDNLLKGVLQDPTALSEALSVDLIERIDEIMEGLSYLIESSEELIIDRRLQYTQFWRDRVLDS